MKGLFGIVLVSCLLALSVADEQCAAFCTSGCNTADSICQQFPINQACPLIKAQCDQACTTACTCFDQCAALCPAPVASNIILQILSASIDVGCQSTCAVTCQVQVAVRTAAGQVAALGQAASGLLGSLSQTAGTA